MKCTIKSKIGSSDMDWVFMIDDENEQPIYTIYFNEWHIHKWQIYNWKEKRWTGKFLGEIENLEPILLQMANIFLLTKNNEYLQLDYTD